MHTPRPSYILARSIAALIAVSGTSFAVDNNWTGATSTDWNTDSNWSDPHGFGIPHVPSNGAGHPGDEDAVINTSTGNIATITATLITAPRDIKVGIFGGQTGILNHSAGTASIGGWFFVGRDGGTGTYNQTGGAMSASRILVGTVAGSVGTYNQSAGTATSTGDRFFVGTEGGTGTYNLADTASVGGPLTGFGTGSGSMTIGGGGRLYVGGIENNQGGTGTMNINTTGTITVPNDLAIGSGNATGVVNMDSGTMTTGGWNFFGKGEGGGVGGTGTLNISGGLLNNTGGRTYIGFLESNGSLVMSGGEYRNNGDTFAVGAGNNAAATTATVSMTGGTINSNLFVIGNDNDNRFGKGQVTLSGASATLNAAADLWIGNGATSTGTMTVSAGNVAVGNWLAIGRSGAIGTLTISGTGSVSQGATSAGSFLELTNFNAGGSATVNLDGGSLTVNGIVHNGGGLGVSTVNFNGGTLRARRDNTTFFQGITAANVLAGGAVLDSNGFAVTIGQSFVDGGGGGGLTKIGAGSVTLAGTNTYTGLTAANGGNLIITGNNFVGTGSTVGASGTLSFGDGGFSGMIDGPVAVAGTLNFNRADDLIYTAVVTGAGTVNKNGPNTLTISETTPGSGVSGFAGFTGTTNVNAGALALDYTQGGAVAVNSGGRLVPRPNATGPLTVGALTLNTNSVTDFEFGPGPANDVIVVNNAGGLSFGSAFTLNFYDVGTLTPFGTNGVYTLFDYNGTFNGNLSNLVVGNPVAGKGYALTDDAGSTSIRLTISTVVLSEWNVAGGGLWTTPSNWNPAVVPNLTSAEAVFGAAITTPSLIDMNGNKTVGKLAFDNSNSYTIGGAGTLTLDNGATASTITVNDTDFSGADTHFINVPITATGNLSITTALGSSLQLSALGGGNALTTNGAGTVILNGAGNYSTTTVNGGALHVGTGGTTGSLGTGPVSLAAGSSLSFIRSDAITVNNAISGGGGVSHNGGGLLTYTGTATYTGPTNLNGPFVNEGTINGTSAMNIENTATLRLASSTTVTGTVAVAASNPASLTVTDTATLTSGGLTVGNGATGALIVSGGTVNGGNVRIGNISDGSLSLSSGRINSSTFVIGEASTGTGTMTAGRIDVSAWNVIGRLAGATGTFNQSGGELNQNHTDFLTVGENGTGIYNMTGTAFLNNQAVVDTSVRTTNKGNVIVGRNSGGIGTWNLSDSATARVRSLRVGDGGGSDGEVNVSGSAAIVSQDHDLFVGVSGTGRVNMNGGTATFNQGWVFIGQNAGGDGTLNINSGSLSSNRFYVGQSGTGNVNVNGGTLTAMDTLLLGENPTGRGIVSVNSGTFNVNLPNGNNNAGVLVSDGGLGVLNISATGSLTTNRQFIVGNGAGGTGHVHVTGGSLTTGELWVGQRIDAGVTGKGLMDVSAGSVTSNNWLAVGREGALGVLNVKSGGTVSKTGGPGSHIIIGSLGGNGTANVIGGTLQTVGGGDIRLGEPGGAGLGSGILNITSGGIVHADRVIDGPGGGAPNQLYFNNGTLRAATSATNFLETLDNAIIGPGGATIDTNGNNVTVNQLLNAPSGDGVTTIPVVDGGLGYVGQPIVEITGDGFGASAIANVVGGVVTSITITNPGINYTTATITLHGGGEAIPAALGAPTFGVNVTTGGLTKIGDGTLTITSDGDYGGATTVNDGTLAYTVSQTMSSLVIGDGSTVVLTESAPAPGLAAAGAPEMAASGAEFGSQVAAVPEPGTFVLLAAGALGVLARRRRTQV